MEEYEAYVSEIVLQEASAGNEEYSKKRIKSIQSLPILEIDKSVIELAEHFIQTNTLPLKAKVDAIHISCAIINQIEFIITWNCKHIANAHNRSKMEKETDKLGLRLPLISTPLVFLGEENNVD